MFREFSKKNGWATTILCVVILGNTFGQSTKDSITIKNQNFIQKSSIKFDIQLQQIKSFISANTVPIEITQVNVGLIKSRLRFGLGFYWADAVSPKAHFIPFDPSIQKESPNAYVIGQKNGTRTYLVSDKINMYYAAPSFEYTFLKSKWIDMGAVTELGIGYSTKTRMDYFTETTIPILGNKNQILNNSTWFLPVSMGLALDINLSSDIKLSGLLGYRNILKEVGASEDFNGMYYQFGINIIPKEIVQEIKKDLKNLYLRLKKK